MAEKKEMSFADFAKLDSKELTSANATYLQLQKNSKYHFKLIGFQEFEGDGGAVQAPLLEDEKGAVFINASTVLVGALSGKPVPSFIRIMTKGDKITKNGSYTDMEVFFYPVK